MTCDTEIVLAHYLDQAYDFWLNGKQVLEVGAGTGRANTMKALRSVQSSSQLRVNVEWQIKNDRIQQDIAEDFREQVEPINPVKSRGLVKRP